jgi:hypothetical protein
MAKLEKQGKFETLSVTLSDVHKAMMWSGKLGKVRDLCSPNGNDVLSKSSVCR